MVNKPGLIHLQFSHVQYYLIYMHIIYVQIIKIDKIYGSHSLIKEIVI